MDGGGSGPGRRASVLRLGGATGAGWVPTAKSPGGVTGGVGSERLPFVSGSGGDAHEVRADIVMTASTTQVPAGGGSTRRWTLALGSFTSFLVGLDALVVATALPTLHQEYGGGVEVLGWTVNAYQLAFAALILTGSTLGDRFGRRRMFIVGVVVFTAASVLCAISPTVEALVAARVAQGVGGGLAVPLSLALIIDAVPPHARGRALGVWGAVTGVAVAAGPLVGGAVVEGLAWQWIFWLNVPVGILIAGSARWKIGESARAFTGRVDLVGLALATAGVFAVAQALIRGDGAGWSSASVVGGLLVGVVILLGFVVWERRTQYPMMPMALFANRGLTAGCGLAAAAGNRCGAAAVTGRRAARRPYRRETTGGPRPWPARARPVAARCRRHPDQRLRHRHRPAVPRRCRHRDRVPNDRVGGHAVGASRRDRDRLRRQQHVPAGRGRIRGGGRRCGLRRCGQLPHGRRVRRRGPPRLCGAGRGVRRRRDRRAAHLATGPGRHDDANRRRRRCGTAVSIAIRRTVTGFASARGGDAREVRADVCRHRGRSRQRCRALHCLPANG